MPINDIMREFEQGVADIEREKTLKKQRPFVSLGIVSGEKAPETPSRGWLMDEFDAGVKEIEQSRAKNQKETPLVPALGRSIATIPLHIGRAVTGLAQKAAEYQKGEREEVRSALQTVRGIEPPKVKKKTKPLTAEEGFGTFVLDLLGKGVEKVGEGIEAISETAPAKAYGKFRAKSRIAEAMVGGELKPEVMKLVKAGDKQSLARAAELLKKDEGFYQSWLSKQAEENITKPIAVAAMAGGKALGKMIEKVRPITKRGSYKYFVTSAIEGVGSTMAPALAASIATKNPGVGMAIMFPQVFGEVYSEERAGGKGVVESSQKGMFYAASEVLSEGLPLGILTKSGGKLTTKIFKSAGAEGIQEAVNEATQIAYDEGIIGEYTPTREIGRRLIEAGIIGAIGGGGMAALTHPFTGKEEEAKDKLKKDILDGITETYSKGEIDADKALDSIIEGYKGGLFDDSDLDKLSGEHPELKDGIKAGKKIVRAELVKEQLSSAIDEGLTTGELNGEEFTLDNAMGFIRSGLENDIFTDKDIDEFKEKYPDLKHELNALIAEKVTADIDSEFVKFEPEPVVKTEKPTDEYALKDIEDTYLKAKERVRTEPISLQEIQERFRERQGREATAKEQNELNRIYEKAKRRSQQKKTFEEKRKEKAGPPKTKEELEFEAYEPSLPPGQAEIRTKEGKRTYPRGAKFVAGKEAPEELKVEYKPILKKTGKKEGPWLTLDGARNALESDKMKDRGVSPATHKVTETKGGYQIVPIKAGGQAMARKAKEEVKGKTLLSWVRAMGGIGDKTLPGEVRALFNKESGVVGLTNARGLSFDEMAAEAVEDGWIEKPEDFSEKLRDDIFAQKEGKQRVERLADIAARTEREERWEEFDRAENDMFEYFAKHPDEEILSDLNEWQKKTVADIRRRDEKRSKEIEEDIKREVEAENPDLEGLKEDEGFSKFVEGWDEKDVLDEETLAELEAWRAEQKTKPEVPEAKPEAPEVKPEEESIVDIVDSAFNERERTNILTKEGIKAVPGIRLQDAEEAGRMAYLVAKGEATQKEFDEWIKRAETENRIRKTKQEALEPKDPVSSLLSSKKKAGVEYEMKMRIAETGETVTVTKDAGVALRETKEELDKMNKFLECLI